MFVPRFALICSLLFITAPLAAQVRLPAGIEAGIDAYREADAARAAAIAHQIQANAVVPYYNRTYTFRVPAPSYGVYPNGPYVYGAPQPYGSWESSEYYRRGVLGGTYRRSTYGEFSLNYGPYSSAYLGVTIQPRPIYPPPVRQPIGQRQVQTGPNRWESYPVYADEEPRETYVPESYELPRESVEVRPKISAPPSRSTGPREF